VCLPSIRVHLPRLKGVCRGFRPLEDRVAQLKDCPL
jgi:hypothetical protein